MTFTEAALAVLEQVGRPLQVRQIADMAVERGLLSHVGKTPVQTMSARISAAITREGEECLFVRVRPGVFALAKWKDHPPGKVAPAARPEPSRGAGKSSSNRHSGRSRETAQRDSSPPASAPAQPAADSRPKTRTQRPAPPAAESVAPEKTGSKESAAEPTRSKRRRSKKTGRAVETAATTNSTATGPARGEVADRVVGYLAEARGAVKGSVLSTRLGFKGRGAASALDAVLAADELERQLSGHAARLARAGQSWKLAVRNGDGAAAELIEQIEGQVARTESVAVNEVRACMSELNLGQLAQVVLVYLARRGFAEPTPVGHQTERSMHWSVRDPYGATRAVVLVHDPKLQVLNESFVIRLRGALHHYGAAGGIILSTCNFDESARREAQVINLPPIDLIGGDKLPAEFVREGLGVRKQQIEIPICDASFFKELI